MNRDVLDELLDELEPHLPPEAHDEVFALARPVRPQREVVLFVTQLLRLSGVASIVAAVIVFVAANWSMLGVLGHFILVQSLLAVGIAIAMWRPPPHAVGGYALLFAFFMTGVAFALYGQTYQTGADPYQLFFSWAFLGLPLALFARWGVVWAAWLVVLNLGLVLWIPPSALGDWKELATILANLALWLLVERANDRFGAHVAPKWLAQLLLAYAIVIGTGVLTVAVIEETVPPQAVAAGVLAALLAGFSLYRRDLAPLVGLACGAIVVSTAAIVRTLEIDANPLTVFLIGVWVLAAAAVATAGLRRLHALWQSQSQEQSQEQSP